MGLPCGGAAAVSVLLMPGDEATRQRLGNGRQHHHAAFIIDIFLQPQRCGHKKKAARLPLVYT